MFIYFLMRPPRSVAKKLGMSYNRIRVALPYSIMRGTVSKLEGKKYPEDDPTPAEMATERRNMRSISRVAMMRQLREAGSLRGISFTGRKGNRRKSSTAMEHVSVGPST